MMLFSLKDCLTLSKSKLWREGEGGKGKDRGGQTGPSLYQERERTLIWLRLRCSPARFCSPLHFRGGTFGATATSADLLLPSLPHLTGRGPGLFASRQSNPERTRTHCISTSVDNGAKAVSNPPFPLPASDVALDSSSLAEDNCLVNLLPMRSESNNARESCLISSRSRCSPIKMKSIKWLLYMCVFKCVCV